MIVYKFEDRFSQVSGKKVGVSRVFDHVICDFTGNKGEYQENLGSAYKVDYGSLDPCMGCMVIEDEVSEKWGFDAYSLSGAYNIDENNVTIMEIIEAYEKDTGGKPIIFNQVLRWARAKTIDRLLCDGVYSQDELGLEKVEEVGED